MEEGRSFLVETKSQIPPVLVGDEDRRANTECRNYERKIKGNAHNMTVSCK